MNMNETMKKNLKRSLAAFLAVLMVAGLSVFAKDSALKADENAPEAEVVREAADMPAEPAPEPEPEVVVQEVIVPAPAEEAPAPAGDVSSTEAAQEETPSQEPAPVWTPAPVAEQTQEAKPLTEEQTTVTEGEPAEKTEPEENAAEPTAAPAKPAFNVEAAYEHYMSLTEDWQKEQYLNSLSAEDRAELKQYIADKEAEAAAQEAILAELAAQAEAETETEENAPAEEAPVMLTVVPDAEEGTEGETEAGEEAAETEAEEIPEEVTEETAEEEPEEEPVDLSFGSAHIGGMWAGRTTSSARNLTINIYVDGNLADSCTTSANQSVANFVIYAGDNEIVDVTTDYWAMSGSGAAWSVDMYGANDVTVNVNMKSLLPAEEEVPAEEVEGTEEAAEEAELTEEPNEAEEAEPSYEVTEEWGGRETSADRTVHLVFMLGEEVLEARDIVGRNAEVTFSAAREGYTVLSVEADTTLTNNGDLYTVNVNNVYEATVTVTLEAPAAEEEEPAEEVTVTVTDEEKTTEITVTGEEKTAEAEEAVTATDDNKTVEIAVTGEEKTTETDEEKAEATYEITSAWGGEETENKKTLTVIINVDGEEKEVKLIEGNSTAPAFTIETEEYELADVTSEAAFTLEENICTVDMSEADEATVVVELISERKEEREEYSGEVTIHLEAVSEGPIGIGSVVKWVSELSEETDATELIYQWEETEDGENWFLIEGANEPEYELTITEDNLTHLWRVNVK